jgi:hypothetical protein
MVTNVVAAADADTIHALATEVGALQEKLARVPALEAAIRGEIVALYDLQAAATIFAQHELARRLASSRQELAETADRLSRLTEDAA